MNDVAKDALESFCRGPRRQAQVP